MDNIDYIFNGGSTSQLLIYGNVNIDTDMINESIEKDYKSFRNYAILVAFVEIYICIEVMLVCQLFTKTDKYYPT